MQLRDIQRFTFGVLCPFLAVSIAGAQTARVSIVSASTYTADRWNEPRFTDVYDKLMATGKFADVDIFNATDIGDGQGTPTLEYLLGFDAIITWSNMSYADPVALGNVLADYVDAGGGVVVAVFANTSTNELRYLQGRWMDEQYYLIEPNSGFRAGLAGGVAIGQRLEPEHPLLRDVEYFYSPSDWVDGLGYWGAFRPNTTNVMAGARPIVLWEDDALLAVVSDVHPNVVELGMHPVSSAVNYRYYWDETTDGDHLMANALLFAAGLLGDCPPDFNGDGVLNSQDFIAFLNAFTAGDPSADYNGDGQVNSQDFIAFLNDFVAGC